MVAQHNVISRSVEISWLLFFCSPMCRDPIPSTHIPHKYSERPCAGAIKKKIYSAPVLIHEEFPHQHSLVSGEGSVKPPAEKKVPLLGLSIWLCFPGRVDTADFWVMSWDIILQHLQAQNKF